jgi:hypothetical protein
MSKKSAGDRYDERRIVLLETEKSLAQGNSRGLFETVILFPRPYDQAMAHLSFHRIHKQLSTWSDTVCSGPSTRTRTSTTGAEGPVQRR